MLSSISISILYKHFYSSKLINNSDDLALTYVKDMQHLEPEDD
jgi:hypothetical protein